MITGIDLMLKLKKTKTKTTENLFSIKKRRYDAEHDE